MYWKITLEILSILSFLAGMLFLLFPKLLRRLAIFLNKWFSLRKLLKPLDIMIYVDDEVYKIRKILGSLFLLLALIFLIVQIRIDHPALKNAVRLLLISNFLIGLSLLLFHRLLKKWDIFFNRWFSLRKFLKPLEVIRDVENGLYKIHRILGILGLTSSLILFYYLARLKIY